MHVHVLCLVEVMFSLALLQFVIALRGTLLFVVVFVPMTLEMTLGCTLDMTLSCKASFGKS
jgi:hypothetical protein